MELTVRNIVSYFHEKKGSCFSNSCICTGCFNINCEVKCNSLFPCEFIPRHCIDFKEEAENDFKKGRCN